MDSVVNVDEVEIDFFKVEDLSNIFVSCAIKNVLLCSRACCPFAGKSDAAQKLPLYFPFLFLLIYCLTVRRHGFFPSLVAGVLSEYTWIEHFRDTSYFSHLREGPIAFFSRK